MKDFNVRFVEERAVPELETWRTGYKDGALEVPHGYVGQNVETVVVEKDGKIVLSLTGTVAIIVDPAVVNPEAAPLDVMKGLILAERTLAAMGRREGAVDAYTAAPGHLKDWHSILKRTGYEETAQGC